MSSFTNSLEKDDISFEHFENEYREWELKMARWDLKSAREQKDDMDVSGYIESIRSCAKYANVSFADLGTSEEELIHLVQTGYKSEARMCFESARDMYGCSLLHLYVRAVRNIGYCFFKRPDFYWLKSFLATLFYFRRPCTRQYYIARTREYLAKANLSPSDIDTYEEKLVQFES